MHLPPVQRAQVEISERHAAGTTKALPVRARVGAAVAQEPDHCREGAGCGPPAHPTQNRPQLTYPPAQAGPAQTWACWSRTYPVS